MSSPFPLHRPRRLRSTAALRRLVRETTLSPSSLIAPLFVTLDGPRRAIPGLPGNFVNTIDEAVAEAASLSAKGVGGVLLFGVARVKDDEGSEAWNPEAAVPTALRAIKAEAPELSLWADVCLCAYTVHGHCGVISQRADGTADVRNDDSLPPLAKAALAYAAAGADVVAPSDMMDGRIGYIRSSLDAHGHAGTAICSYAVKYASAFYGPFRGAANSAPAAGDRRSYQMDPANTDEALREVALDVAEGADLVMIKPALAYLDVVYRVKRRFRVPTAAYNVSGEYAMVTSAADRGWLDKEAAQLEILTSIARAGADIIVTYGAGRVAELLS